MALYTLDIMPSNALQFRVAPEPTIEPIYARVKHCSQTKATTTESHPEGYQRYMNWREGNAPIREIGRGLPSCFKYHFTNETYLFLNESQERWWYNRLIEAGQGMMTDAQIKSAWTNLVQPDKAFTNVKGGYGLGYILNDPEHPGGLRLEPVICTGMTVKLKGKPYLKGDGFYWQNFEIIDMLKDDYKSMTIASHWWLIGAATNSVNTDNVNAEKIDPWPKMAGNRKTVYFLWGLGTTTGAIRADWLQPIYQEIDRAVYPYMPYQKVADEETFMPYGV